jgi:hypothetical protein
MLPVIYPMPWILGAAFRKQIRAAVAQESMKLKMANLCNDWLTTMLVVTYAAIMSFGQLHAGY